MRQRKVGVVIAIDGTHYDMLKSDRDEGVTLRRNPPKPYKNRHEQKLQKKARRHA